MSVHQPSRISIPSLHKARANRHRLHVPVLIFGFVSLLAAQVFAADRWLVAMANPAAVACKEAGGQISKIYTDKGEQGMCTLPSGVVCEEWAFFKGMCGQDKPSATPSASEPLKPSSSEVRKK